MVNFHHKCFSKKHCMINKHNKSYLSLKSNKMVVLVLVRRWEKRNRSNFYWYSWKLLKVSRILSVCVGSIQLGVLGILAQKSLYGALRPDIVQNILWLPDQRLSIPFDQIVLTLLVIYIYNENIQTFWHRKLCVKTWYSSKSLLIFSIFLVWFFDSKYCNTSQLYTTIVLKIFIDIINCF